MRLFPPDLEIGQEEGFDQEKDIFGRRQFGYKLTKIVQALEHPAVLLLDGYWGTGKTTFIKMWLGELSKLGVPTIYFDAFANDYHEDAFITLAGEIVARAEELGHQDSRSFAAFKEGAINVGKALVRASLRIGVRVASAGVLTGAELEGIKITGEAAKAAGDETAKALDDLLKERLESHKADRAAFERFKAALTDLIQVLSPSGEPTHGKEEATPDKGSTPSLIFVIDELDRCRPSFALDLLEKIKHFFGTEGVIFILVSSLRQLESAVHYAYGDVEARAYLEKFYHLRLLFPSDAAGHPHERATAIYLMRLFPGEGAATRRNIILNFCVLRPLSLRTLERIAAYMNIISVSTPIRSVEIAELFMVLCIIKVLDPDLYRAARNKRLTLDQLNNFLRTTDWKDEGRPQEPSQIGTHVWDWWAYVLGGQLNEGTKETLRQSLAQYNFGDPAELIPYYCDLIDGFAFPDEIETH